jgi:hypothetical protein
MAVSAFKRVLATLDNGQAIYLYNADMNAELTAPVVLSSQPIIRTSQDGSEVYKFNHNATGWFGSIKPDDTDRMDNVMQLGDGDILIKVSPIKSYDIKDLAKATKFVGGN